MLVGTLLVFVALAALSAGTAWACWQGAMAVSGSNCLIAASLGLAGVIPAGAFVGTLIQTVEFFSSFSLFRDSTGALLTFAGAIAVTLVAACAAVGTLHLMQRVSGREVGAAVLGSIQIAFTAGSIISAVACALIAPAMWSAA